jgi:hypothetical protein
LRVYERKEQFIGERLLKKFDRIKAGHGGPASDLIRAQHLQFMAL